MQKLLVYSNNVSLEVRVIKSYILHVHTLGKCDENNVRCPAEKVKGSDVSDGHCSRPTGPSLGLNYCLIMSQFFHCKLCHGKSKAHNHAAVQTKWWTGRPTAVFCHPYHQDLAYDPSFIFLSLHVMLYYFLSHFLGVYTCIKIILCMT